MKLATILEEIRGNHRCAIADGHPKAFGDYHNLLRWLAVFLRGDEKLADGCIVDACTIPLEHPALSPEYFLLLIKSSEDINARLDVLCRSVLVLHGIANDSYDKVAVQLGISRSAVERAYCVAFDALEPASDGVTYSADVPASHPNNERTLADSTA